MQLIRKLALTIAVSAIGFFPLTSNLSWAQTSSIEVKAENSLEKMFNYLENQSSLSFQADISQDLVFSNGQKIQLGAVARLKVRRPDKLHIDYQGDRRHVRFYFDGQTFTMEGLSNNVYANFPAPAETNSVNFLVNNIEDKLNITLPLGEIISTENGLESIRERNISGVYVGESIVNGIACHHLAFRQEDLDWQIWIEKGDQALPRKLVITYKDNPYSPQYSAVLSDWNFHSISAQDPIFFFKPATDANKIDFVIIEE
ncbi:putative periplasmic protein [Xenococcus sp. PCC 7305]|uniref:DUF2092 domain-containing protein n=1 Tax=Xenococcus sp. PCC 7305 TaxID=102125 RepID=UPI0002ACEBAC|nr:DUF2092 domain-containing protein [Xenococcus sp. PCC 7305]ELS04664.1 putative periplasmic protein [Xenococcus sp. PCC 7305]